MTNFNNQNGYVPTPNKPTFTVSYYNPETDQNLTQEEWQTLNPVSDQVRIVSQNEVYRSWKADLGRPVYGPANEDYLACPCPSKGCENENIIKWVHASDNNRLKIDKWATIWCTKSDCSTSGHMKEWCFACPNHETKFKKTSSLEFSKDLFIASDGDMDSELLDELTKYLKKPENKW